MCDACVNEYFRMDSQNDYRAKEERYNSVITSLKKNVERLDKDIRKKTMDLNHKHLYHQKKMKKLNVNYEKCNQ